MEVLPPELERMVLSLLDTDCLIHYRLLSRSWVEDVLHLLPQQLRYKALAVTCLHNDLTTAQYFQQQWQFSPEEGRQWRLCDFLRAAFTSKTDTNLPLLQWLHCTFQFTRHDIIHPGGNLLQLAAISGKVDRLNWLHHTFHLKPKHWATRCCQGFIWAARHGNLEGCQWLATLLELSTDYLSATVSPLRVALRKGHIHVLNWMKERFTLKPHMVDINLLQLAARKGRTLPLMWVVKVFEVPRSMYTASLVLYPCITHGNYSLAHWLLGTREKEHATAEAFVRAAGSGDVEAIRALPVTPAVLRWRFAEGIRLAANAGHIPVLHWLRCHHRVLVRKLLLKHEYLALTHLCELGQLKSLMFLQTAFDLKPEHFRKGLIPACTNGHLEVCCWLYCVWNKCPPVIQVYLEAAKRGNLALLHWLVDTYRILPEELSDQVSSILLFAAIKGRLNVVKWLVEWFPLYTHHLQGGFLPSSHYSLTSRQYAVFEYLEEQLKQSGEEHMYRNFTGVITTAIQ